MDASGTDITFYVENVVSNPEAVFNLTEIRFTSANEVLLKAEIRRKVARW
jgi:hypothetical protein